MKLYKTVYIKSSRIFVNCDSFLFDTVEADDEFINGENGEVHVFSVYSKDGNLEFRCPVNEIQTLIKVEV